MPLRSRMPLSYRRPSAVLVNLRCATSPAEPLIGRRLPNGVRAPAVLLAPVGCRGLPGFLPVEFVGMRGTLPGRLPLLVVLGRWFCVFVFGMGRTFGTFVFGRGLGLDRMIGRLVLTVSLRACASCCAGGLFRCGGAFRCGGGLLRCGAELEPLVLPVRPPFRSF